MNSLPKIAAICIALTLPGCANLGGGIATAAWPWPENSAKLCGPCNAKQALIAFNDASKFCRDVQNYYESGGRRQGSNQVYIGALGSIAGSVLAPISKGTAATAWSGLSGATNALQLSIDEAFSANVAVKRRVAVSDAAKTAANAYNTETDYDKKFASAVNMARNCAMGAADADKIILKAITD